MQNELKEWSSVAMQAELGKALANKDYSFADLSWAVPFNNPATKVFPLKEGESAPDLRIGEMFGVRLVISENIPEGEAHLRHKNQIIARFNTKEAQS